MMRTSNQAELYTGRQEVLLNKLPTMRSSNRALDEYAIAVCLS